MSNLEERFQQGQAMRDPMSGGDRGYFNTRTAMQIARSVLTEWGVTV
jgi:hypothetical protein